MGTLGFEKYSEPLKSYLGKYRDSVRGDKPEKKYTSKKEQAAKLAAEKSMGLPFAGVNLGGLLANMPEHDPNLTLPTLAPGKSEVMTIILGV